MATKTETTKRTVSHALFSSHNFRTPLANKGEPEWVLDGYSLLIPFSHHTSSQFCKARRFGRVAQPFSSIENGWGKLFKYWKWLGQPGRNVVLCKTDCWCDEKKQLKAYQLSSQKSWKHTWKTVWFAGWNAALHRCDSILATLVAVNA